jgi:hypothetical protein
MMLHPAFLATGPQQWVHELGTEISETVGQNKSFFHSVDFLRYLYSDARLPNTKMPEDIRSQKSIAY